VEDVEKKQTSVHTIPAATRDTNVGNEKMPIEGNLKTPENGEILGTAKKIQKIDNGISERNTITSEGKNVKDVENEQDRNASNNHNSTEEKNRKVTNPKDLEKIQQTSTRLLTGHGEKCPIDGKNEKDNYWQEVGRKSHKIVKVKVEKSDKTSPNGGNRFIALSDEEDEAEDNEEDVNVTNYQMEVDDTNKTDSEEEVEMISDFESSDE